MSVARILRVPKASAQSNATFPSEDHSRAARTRNSIHARCWSASRDLVVQRRRGAPLRLRRRAGRAPSSLLNQLNRYRGFSRSVSSPTRVRSRPRRTPARRRGTAARGRPRTRRVPARRSEARWVVQHLLEPVGDRSRRRVVGGHPERTKPKGRGSCPGCRRGGAVVRQQPVRRVHARGTPPTTQNSRGSARGVLRGLESHRSGASRRVAKGAPPRGRAAADRRVNARLEVTAAMLSVPPETRRDEGPGARTPARCSGCCA